MSIKEDFWQFWVRREGGLIREGYAVVCTPGEQAMLEHYKFDEIEDPYPDGTAYWVGWANYISCVQNLKADGFEQGVPADF